MNVRKVKDEGKLKQNFNQFSHQEINQIWKGGRKSKILKETIELQYNPIWKRFSINVRLATTNRRK